MLAQLFERRSLDNPSTNFANASFWQDQKTHAGVSIDPHGALRLSAAFACLRVISETFSTVSCDVFERLKGPGASKRLATEHPLYEVVHLRGNTNTSAQGVFEVVAAHVAGYGNGYFNVQYDAGGEVRGLWPLLPDRTHPKIEVLERDSSGLPTRTRKILKSDINGRETTFYPAWDETAPADRRYTHIPFWGFDGLRGYSPLYKARETMAYGLAMEEHGSRFFSQGATIPYQVTHPASLSETAADKIRKGLREMHQGLTGAHRVALLDEGMKLEPIGMDHSDAEWLASTNLNVVQVARFFRMQPHKIQHLENSTYSNIEMQSIEHVVDTIRPYAVRFEQYFDYDLFRPDERGRFFVRFNLEALMRGDSAARAEYNSKMFMIGAKSRNEIRQSENMNPLEDDPTGDLTFVPVNMVPAKEYAGGGGSAETDPARMLEGRQRTAGLESAKARQRLQKAYVRLFQAAAQRYVTKEIRALMRLLTRAVAVEANGQEWRELYKNEMGELHERLEPEIARELLAVLSAFGGTLARMIADEMGVDLERVERGLDGFIDALANRAAERHTRRTRFRVERLMGLGESDADTFGGMRDTYQRWLEDWPEQIGHYESVRAGGAIAIAAFKGGGALMKRWYTIGENCPKCDRMNGRVIGIDENFASAGDIVSGDEGDDSPLRITRSGGHPPLHRSDGKSGTCDCVVGV